MRQTAFSIETPDNMRMAWPFGGADEGVDGGWWWGRPLLSLLE